MLKLYRKEPLIGFALTIGAVDAAIGGLSEHWSLMSMGMGLVGMSVGMRLWQVQHRPVLKQPKRKSLYALPPAETRSPLPPLSLKKTPPENS